MALPSFLQAMFTPARSGSYQWQNRPDQGGGEFTGEIEGVYEGDAQDLIFKPRAHRGPGNTVGQKMPDATNATTGMGQSATQDMMDAVKATGLGGDYDSEGMSSISEVMETSAPSGFGGWQGGKAGDALTNVGGRPGTAFDDTFTPQSVGDPGFQGTQIDTSVTSPLIQQGSPIGEMAGGWADEGDPGAVGLNAGSEWLPQFEATQDDIGGPPIPEDSGINPLAAAGGIMGGAGLAASAPWWMKLLGKTFTPMGARAVPTFSLSGMAPGANLSRLGGALKYKDVAHLLGKGLPGVTGGAVGSAPLSTVGGALSRLSLPITAALFFNEMRKNPQMHPGNLDPKTTGTGAAVAAGQDLSGLPSGTEKYMRQARIPEIEIKKVLGENYVGPTL